MNTHTGIPRFIPKIEMSVPAHYSGIYEKYKRFSMVADNPQLFMENLFLMDFIRRSVEGDFVECGTWKGGMSCGMMSVGGDARNYHFFDSFEGLPEAQEIDGVAALEYQKNTASPLYRDNCAADYQEFLDLVYTQNVPDEHIHVYKGWFSETLASYPGHKISVLRLDGDWYDSTIQCLNALYHHVAPGGIILLDDYDAWDGCARAVHDFLGSNQSRSRIMRTPLMQIAYIQKLEA